MILCLTQITQISQITHRLRSRYHPDGSKGAAPTRYDSVGCDEGRFIFPEELLSKAKSKFVRSV